MQAEQSFLAERYICHVLSAVDDFFDQRDPSIATPIEEVYGPQEKLY